jgi:spermidine/putrescine transport system ATP-binding protein
VVDLWDPAEARDTAGYDCALDGRIQNRIYLGDQTEFSIATATLGSLLVRAPKTAPVVAGGLGQGATVRLGWRRENALALVES